MALSCERHYCSKTLGVPTFANQPKSIFQRIDPNLIRHRIRTQNTMINVPPHHSTGLRLAFEPGNPTTDFIEALRQFHRSRSFNYESPREYGSTAYHAGQQYTSVPQFKDLSTEVCWRCPVHVACLCFSARYSSIVRLRR